jgi:dethiobiotin synthetase
LSVPAIFIAGTGTDVGKTHVTVALIEALRAAGLALGALKPVVSGFENPAGSDPARLLEALGEALTPQSLDRMSPWRYRAPLAPDHAARLEGRSVSFDAVARLCEDRAGEAGGALLFIESAGGVMSPLSDDHTMLDLAERLGAGVILVAGSYLGTISHTLTAVLALRSRGAPLLAIVISENAPENAAGPDLEETRGAVARFLPGVPIFLAPRDAPAPDGLIALLRQLG